MSRFWRVVLLSLALVTPLVSGCVVVVGPRWYPPPPPPVYPPPPCPDGFYWNGLECAPAPPPPVPADPAPGAVYTKVRAAKLALRSCPAANCAALAVLGPGEDVAVLGYSEGWARVWSPSRGLEGWVASRYLSDH